MDRASSIKSNFSHRVYRDDGKLIFHNYLMHRFKYLNKSYNVYRQIDEVKMAIDSKIKGK